MKLPQEPAPFYYVSITLILTGLFELVVTLITYGSPWAFAVPIAIGAIFQTIGTEIVRRKRKKQ